MVKILRLFALVYCILPIRKAYYFISFNKTVKGSKKEKNNENFVLKSLKTQNRKKIFAKTRGGVKVEPTSKMSLVSEKIP